jgi:hypothetical protein
MLNSNLDDYEVLIYHTDSFDPTRVPNTMTKVNITFLTSRPDVGLTRALNRLIGLASGHYIVRIDDDVGFDSKCIENLIAELDKDEACCMAQPFIFGPENGEPETFGQTLDRWGFDHVSRRAEGVRSVFYAAGALNAAKRDCLLAVATFGKDVFDPDYWWGWEDVDLGWRILLSGMRIVSVPTAVAYHRSLRGTPSPEFVYLQSRNRLCSFLKNYGLWMLLSNIIPLIVVELARIAIQRRYAAAIVKAIMWNLWNLKATVAKRNCVQKRIRKVADAHIMRYMSRPSVAYLFRQHKRVYRR